MNFLAIFDYIKFNFSFIMLLLNKIRQRISNESRVRYDGIRKTREQRMRV